MERIARFGFFERRFTASFSENPFDIRFSAEVIGPDGQRKVVSGFYDGGQDFAFRYMPETEGEYCYITKSTLKELDRKSGSFLCVAADQESHGMVQVKDQYWFAHRDGTPYFDAGTTCYAWIYQTEKLQRQRL